MSSERVRSALSIFREACELSAPERAAFVQAACAGDPDLLVEVQSMLAWDADLDDEAGPHPVRAALSGLLERAAVDARGRDDADEPAPAAIGAYRVVGLIARGGMGDVYEAWQDHPARRVAIKVARAGGAGGAGGERASRFAREVQLLARLRHPGIASILDAGTTGAADGERPYFVMEFVDGQPLTDFAAAHLTGARPRLELMARVCAAVAHAHAQGIVHRDLKPDNVFAEADGTPRVLDFGIAKVHEAAGLGAATLRTEAGRVLGTMGYMAPEQLAGRAAELGPSADVYSLGVMLYELLTGHLPHDLTEATLTRALAIVASTDAPLLGVIRPEFRGDIEALVAKALEKDPRHRYADAGALQQDIERHLRGEPTLARPAGPLLRVTKWTRRNPLLASSVFGLFLALSALAVLLSASTSEARAALAQQARLLDVRRAAMARADTEKLWPTRPATVSAFQQWLDDRQQLAERLPGYRAWLGEFRERAGRRVGERWTFADEVQQREHDDVAQMVQDIEALHDDTELLARIRARLELAQTVVERTVASRRADWDAANARIETNPRYGGGLTIAPRVGFVPLGPDPDSGLEEFLELDTHTGPLPVRDAQGRVAITEQTGIVFVLIPGGTFTMGAQKDDPDGPNYDPSARPQEEPPHAVTLAPFYLSKYELTRGQWLRVSIAPARFGHPEGEPLPPRPLLWPAGNIGRDELMQKLAHLELSLPTEAQWEYAARAVDAQGRPSGTIWSGCATAEELPGKANLAGRESVGKGPFRGRDAWVQDDHVFVAPVGSYPPNTFGLHDVMGNVGEWCSDPMGNYATDGVRPDDGFRISDDPRMLFRGGTFAMGSWHARAALRFANNPATWPMFDVGARPAAVCPTVR